MDQQIIIAIDREFGSGGQEIARILSKRLELPLYDHNIIKILKSGGSIQHSAMREFDENPRRRFFSRTVRGLTNSNEDGLAMMQFEFLQDQAKKGNSFIVLGHCANEILKEFPNLISIFISAEESFKVERTMKAEDLSEQEARLYINKKNRDRKNYHNSYCKYKWGDSRHYDLCMMTSPLGVERSALFILDYLILRFAQMEI